MLRAALKCQGAKLRIVTHNSIFALCAELYSGFHIGEILWSGPDMRITTLKTLTNNLLHLHTIWISPRPVRISCVTNATVSGEEYVHRIHSAFVVEYGIMAWIQLFGERGLQVKVRMCNVVV